MNECQMHTVCTCGLSQAKTTKDIHRPYQKHSCRINARSRPALIGL